MSKGFTTYSLTKVPRKKSSGDETGRAELCIYVIASFLEVLAIAIGVHRACYMPVWLIDYVSGILLLKLVLNGFTLVGLVSLLVTKPTSVTA